MAICACCPGLRMLPGDFNAFCALEQGQWDGVASVFYRGPPQGTPSTPQGTPSKRPRPTQSVAPSRALGLLRPSRIRRRWRGARGGEHVARLLALLASRLAVFDILKVVDTPCDYTSDGLSMLQQGFKALFFVAKKKK